jgi:exodeoxyribonuclease-3
MPDEGWSLLTLNVARPTRERAEGLLAYLWSRPEQVLVLTEVGTGGGSGLLAAVCRAAGYTVTGLGPNLRDLGVLVVGRDFELTTDAVPRPALLPGRVETVIAHTPTGDVRVAGVYGAASDPVRYASAAQRQRKRDWLDAFDGWLAGWLRPGCPQVLIGDLNIADPVHGSGLRYLLNEEIAAYGALSHEHGLTDAWRLANPDAVGVSWTDHTGAGCRYDHAFVTADLVDAVASCELDDTPRTEGLTDHAALSLALRL